MLEDMSSECTVVIAPPELMAALCSRLQALPGELIPCPDSDIPHAVDLVVERKPQRIAIERLFAATARGAALLTRIKADPGLIDVEIRIVSHDSDYSRVSPRRPLVEQRGVAPVAVAAPLPALDKRGTRLAERSMMLDGVAILVDGSQASLVDLSTAGAQVLSSTVLKPNQRVRVSMVDERVTLRTQALVIWATFELLNGASGPLYRAGLQFTGVDAEGVADYLARHRKPAG
jgi:PilZ domain